MKPAPLSMSEARRMMPPPPPRFAVKLKTEVTRDEPPPPSGERARWGDAESSRGDAESSLG